MTRLMALALVVALALPTLAVTARAAYEHRLVIQFVPTPVTLEECVNAMQNGELHGLGGNEVRLYDGDYYDLGDGDPFKLYCTKLKPVLREGTERD